jgi:hypothetical protein
MFENMRRLHPRGATSRGICVDAGGAVLGPDCVLVQRTPLGFHGIDRGEASTIQKCVLDDSRDQDWLFRQCQRIADALDKGEVALAQIHGLYIPVGDLDERQLRRIALVGLAKAGFNPDEPRVPKGDPRGGEWTNGGGSGIAPDSSIATLDAVVTAGDGTLAADGGPGGTDAGNPPPMEYSTASGGSDANSDRTPATVETPSNGTQASTPESPVNGPPAMPLRTIAADADAAATSLLGQLPAETITALTELAARMTAATIVFRILFIPSNGSVVVEGNVANAPDLSYRYDRDTGIVEVWRDDGTGGRTLLDTGHIGVDGRFYDRSGRAIGRALSNAAVIDPDTLPGYRSQSRTGTVARPLALADTAEPKLCPDPTPENTAGRSDRTIAYQSQITGLPPGLEIVFNGERYDGCRDTDGHLLEAKGEGYANKMLNPTTWREWFTGIGDLEKQMDAHSTYAGSRVVEYYFAEPTVAEFFRIYAKKYPNVWVFYVPSGRIR